MKTDFIHQYAHTWKVMKRVVNDFTPDAWLHTGRGAYTPARLSFHILQATTYYLQDHSIQSFASGKSFAGNPWELSEETLPSQADLVSCIDELSQKTENWISAADFEAENPQFPWAGKTQSGVVLFLLRHSLFHVGELSSLLNESKNGLVEDHYVKAISSEE